MNKTIEVEYKQDGPDEIIADNLKLAEFRKNVTNETDIKNLNLI